MIRISESRLPVGYVASDLGQSNEHTAADGARYILVSFLSSPLRVKTIQEYAVFVIGGDADQYNWTFEPIGGPPIRTDTTPIGRNLHFFTAPDSYEVRVEVVDGGNVVATLMLLQVVTTPDNALEQHFVDNKVDLRTADQIRELRTDLGAYIQQASDLTGPKGIPTRFVSTIVCMETITAPKRGSFGGYLFDKAGNKTKVREFQHDLLAELYEKGKPSLGTSPLLGSPPTPATLGPGQVGQWRAAALEGWLTWREFPAAGAGWMEVQRKRILIQDITEFVALVSYDRQVDCFNLCRFPKTNVAMVAKLLAKLKNRSHRWPDVLKQNVMANSGLTAIVATEYRNGPTLTPAATAGPDPLYAGMFAWQQDPFMTDMPAALFP